MKLYKCTFNYDDGAWHSRKTKFVFSVTDDLDKIRSILEGNSYEGYDSLISGLIVEEVLPYDGMVL